MEQKILHDHGQPTAEILAAMPDGDAFLQAAETFQMMGDPTRLRILWLLCHSEECVQNIAVAISMSAPAVSHHLRALKAAGLIVNRRIGKEIHYRLAEGKRTEMLHKMIDDLFEAQGHGQSH